MDTELLSVRKINAYYADSHVLHDVSIGLKPGRLLTLLGRNGAGKSTCINAIVGFLPPFFCRCSARSQSVVMLLTNAILNND